MTIHVQANSNLRSGNHTNKIDYSKIGLEILRKLVLYWKRQYFQSPFFQQGSCPSFLPVFFLCYQFILEFCWMIRKVQKLFFVGRKVLWSGLIRTLCFIAGISLLFSLFQDLVLVTLVIFSMPIGFAIPWVRLSSFGPSPDGNFSF